MKQPALPATLTAAAAQACVFVMMTGVTSSLASNARAVPYAERYRQASGLMETPAEYIQKAAEDEAKRAADQ